MEPGFGDTDDEGVVGLGCETQLCVLGPILQLDETLDVEVDYAALFLSASLSRSTKSPLGGGGGGGTGRTNILVSMSLIMTSRKEAIP